MEAHAVLSDCGVHLVSLGASWKCTDEHGNEEDHRCQWAPCGVEVRLPEDKEAGTAQEVKGTECV